MGTAAVAVVAQDGTDRVSVPLTDPNRPVTVRVDLMHGNIAVKPNPGKDVVVERTGGGGTPARRSNRPTPPEVDGLKRIDMGRSGFSVEESENTVRINSGPVPGGNVTVLVPANASLKLKTMTGTVDVEGVNGEVEANSMNGEVHVNNVQGAVVAHSLNGKVLVTLARVDPNKPMAFSTMNGDIDVTLPADTKARIRLKNDHGDVWTDFDLKLEATPRVEQTQRGDDGRYRVKFDRTVTGTINGGGPDLSFTTMNGQIRIRKQK